MSKQLKEINSIDSDTTGMINEKPFYKWLESQDNKNVTHFVDTIINYCELMDISLGKDKPHKIKAEDLNTLKITFNHFWWGVTHDRYPKAL